MAWSSATASFSWGINTVFRLDAGLSNLEAFAANAFLTAGMVLFEVPTGVIADGWGRRVSFLLGTVTLAASTYLYYLLWQLSAPFWAWALVSVLLGLGFTFFSGAVEAWLVDALRFSGYDGELEAVFGRALMVSGVAMLVGSTAGGVIAQATDLRALPGQRNAGFAHVQVDDFGVGGADGAQLLGQENGGVAGAAARHQRAKTVLERLLAGKTVVVDHGQVFQPGQHQPLVLVLRIARRVGQGFVLAANVGQVVLGHDVFPEKKAKSKKQRSIVFAPQR